jgi:hypothetical protein
VTIFFYSQPCWIEWLNRSSQEEYASISTSRMLVEYFQKSRNLVSTELVSNSDSCVVISVIVIAVVAVRIVSN